MDLQLSNLINLRRALHKNPELSGQEKQTAFQIKQYLSKFKADEIIEDLGGHGIAFIFNGKQSGPTLMFRAELDALPIDEINQFDYRSTESGVSHKCGHDGHMTIIAGLAEEVSKMPPSKGRVVLLFQPAEETGQGAKEVLEDPKFQQIKPDYIFALHNIPGFKKNSILLKDDVFSSASIGLIIRLKGKTSHASEPEKGQNPAFVMADTLKKIEKYALPSESLDRIKIITPIYCRLGEQAFGTSPGYAEMMFTLRATHTADFEDLKEFVMNTVKDSIQKRLPACKLQMENEWVEAFPNTKNDLGCNKVISEAATLAEYPIAQISFPFRWSEDFGYFLEKYPGALFGLGAGIDQPALHNPDYDFPDELIESGIRVFSNIYKIILK